MQRLLESCNQYMCTSVDIGASGVSGYVLLFRRYVECCWSCSSSCGGQNPNWDISL